MKKGFTLAETLITLGIIGVVAALTIPTLSVSTKEKSLEAKEKVCVSDLENALTTMMASEGAADLDETKAFTETNGIVNNLQKYIKVYKSSNTKCSMKNGAIIEFSTEKPYKMENSEGGEIEADEYTASCTIDVNGAEKPDLENIDQFKYAVLKTGLLEKIGKITKEKPIDTSEPEQQL